MATCNALDKNTGITCGLMKGHAGAHCGYGIGYATGVRWVDSNTYQPGTWNGLDPKAVFSKRFLSTSRDCTCGARPTLQHKIGCPLREEPLVARPLTGAGDYVPGHCSVGVVGKHQFAAIDLDAAACSADFKVESAARKAAPLWSGCMAYFPNALLAVARLSKKANDKHNPGEPLHWSEEKSNDHADCIARHQLNPEQIDPEFDEVHAVMVAWRALAQLELIERKRNGLSRITKD